MSSIQESYAIIRLFGNYYLEYALRPEHLTKDLENIAACVATHYFTILGRLDYATEEQGKEIRTKFALFQEGKLRLERIIQ